MTENKRKEIEESLARSQANLDKLKKMMGEYKTPPKSNKVSCTETSYECEHSLEQEILEHNEKIMYTRFKVKVTWNQDVFLKIGRLVIIGQYAYQFRFINCDSASQAQSAALLMFRKDYSEDEYPGIINLRAKVTDSWIVTQSPK